MNEHEPKNPFWKRRSFRWLIAFAAVPVLAVGWWLGSPLFLDNEVDEAFPLSASAEVPSGSSQDAVEKEMEEAADTDNPMPEDEAMPDDPVAVLSGTFAGADDFHRGSGTATVYELADGSRILRLEDFEVTNGPDLHVLAVPNSDPTSRDDIVDYVDLGKLKGNIGNQNYDIPADIGDFGSIVIYCEPFHVLFASASITPAG